MRVDEKHDYTRLFVTKILYTNVESYLLINRISCVKSWCLSSLIDSHFINRRKEVVVLYYVFLSLIRKKWSL